MQLLALPLLRSRLASAAVFALIEVISASAVAAVINFCVGIGVFIAVRQSDAPSMRQSLHQSA